MKFRPTRRMVIAGVTAAAAVMAIAGGVTFAQAEGQKFYVQIGGTGAAAAAPDCTKTFGPSNEGIDGTAVPICYPASFGPLQGGDGAIPAPNAPRYDDSVKQGVDETLKKIGEIHAQDPGASITVVGYSQGADVGDRVLEKIAKGETDIAKEVMAGKLYADPRQPGTGIWAKIPAGISFEGITSPGGGPADFNGIPVERHCIAHDGICDATSLDSFRGYFEDHPKYPAKGGIMPSSMKQPAQHGVIWHKT